MGQKDLSQKKLEDYHDVFADIHNVLVFGEKRMEAGHLHGGATESVYRAGTQELREQRRDTFKEYRDGERYIISAYGLENQGKYDRYMPLRVMGYDYASYRQQLMELEEANREEQAKERGSIRLKRNRNRIQNESRKTNQKQKPYPVITTVLNFSNERWGGNKSLHEMLEIPEGLKEYVADYKIRVVDVAFLPEETIAEFESDFKAVAAFFRSNRLKQRMPDETELGHPEAVADFLSAFTGDTAYQDMKPLIKSERAKGRVIKMCWMTETLLEEGKSEGIKIGETRGILQTLNSLVADKIIGIDEAARRAGMTVDKYMSAVREL